MSFPEKSDAMRVKRLSHIALGVKDLHRQAEYYVDGCGLKTVEETAQHLYLRATGTHSHAVELMGGEKGIHHVAFEVSDDPALDRSAEILRKHGVSIVMGPERAAEPGIGRLLRFRDPEGNMIELVSEVTGIPDGYEAGPVKALSLNYVILYAGDLSKQEEFYARVLGMRVTDTVPELMTCLRCNPNHHSFGFIAFPRRGLQHAAFDVTLAVAAISVRWCSRSSFIFTKRVGGVLQTMNYGQYRQAALR